MWISACAFCALSGSVQFSCTFLACSFLRDLVAIFILYFWSFVASENFVALLAQCSSSYHSLLHLLSLLRRNNLSWFLFFFFDFKRKKFLLLPAQEGEEFASPSHSDLTNFAFSYRKIPVSILSTIFSTFGFCAAVEGTESGELN